MIVRIAVVDNDDSILELMHEVLADNGWVSIPFVQAAGVVEALARDKPDAVILDARLDGNQGGWTVLAQLLDNSETCGIPVAIWTGGGDGVEDREHWLSEHHVQVIRKPFELDEVYETLGAMLNDRGAAPPRHVPVSG